MSSFEHGYDFMPLADDENFPSSVELLGEETSEADLAEPETVYSESEWRESTARLQMLDLGPSEHRFDRNLGPDSAEEEQVFADAGSRRYIEGRPSNGVHCMDDRVTEAGIQLPGGLLETRVVGRYMDPGVPAVPVAEAYDRVASDLRQEGWGVWVHGDSCAASLFKREALLTAAHYNSAASDFQYEIMDALELPYEENDFIEALATGGERAQNDRLWGMSSETALRVNSARPAVNREDFSESHKAAGLRIDVTGERFNNNRFRQDHDGVGLLSVTTGAYRDMLRARGFPEEQIIKEITYLNIFTFGIAKAVGHQYLLAGMVKD